ncbi:hypothetical protein C4J87_3406 [Pseudomonas sp. R1-43-08]|uniref:hypothetical protein n=1 Tax=Pseudomonas sp. R1-43-08 TaxID=1173270 RepID=UPI000F55D956|nr:hypothetical protein [Pseudomonas sp. R1-43-08]AZF43549.1 hypothetical protein C4J87_3406 [Pseudomonas sp. R1-43-08]
MDATKLQLLYLKLLYSGLDEAEGETHEAKFLLRNMKLDRLAVERAARLRNLRTVLYSDMKVLNRVLSPKALLPYIEAYATSPCFWKHLGRSQVEDFCLYLVSRDDIGPVMRAACEIEGVYSGLSSRPDKATPWPPHRVEIVLEQVLECFSIPFSITWKDAKGNDAFIVKDCDRYYTCTVKVSKERVTVYFV